MYKKFLDWSKAGIFAKAHERVIYEKVLMNNNKHTTIDLIIDSTGIYNKKGSELAKYGKNKKKKVILISYVYSSLHDIVYDIRPFDGNATDVNTIAESVEAIIQNTKYRNINLTGDKGYISIDMKTNLKKRNINLIYPSKKNMKVKTSPCGKKKLAKRYMVENFIGKHKRYPRICMRYDRHIHTYMSMCYIGLMTYITMPTYK